MYGTTAISCVRHISMYYSPPPHTLPQYHLIVFSYLSYKHHLFVRAFQTNITLDIRTVFFLLICVTLNFEYPFSQRPIVFFRKKGEGLKL